MDIKKFVCVSTGLEQDGFAAAIGDVWHLDYDTVTVGNVSRLLTSFKLAGRPTVLLGMPGCGKTSVMRAQRGIGFVDFDLNKDLSDFATNDSQSLKHLADVWINIMKNRITLIIHPFIFLKAVMECGRLFDYLNDNNAEILLFLPDVHTANDCVQRVLKREGESPFYLKYKSKAMSWFNDIKLLVLAFAAFLVDKDAIDHIGFNISPALLCDPSKSESDFRDPVKVAPDWDFNALSEV